ncbi:serine--tRNA ligase, putative [Plasmodium knowlesi strain H]|uniref:serine--tRNA ligase n=3 Tax=Plasmodium knowlesi TaxID=5850 RepID=A0A5K1UNR8_PLAKH|nr:serine--tRNA ligase, putative [Plasmodium knowlesi strain H]OTN68535.1 putative Serine--tRNA ligase [Plasmodium knowlesi]CAA9986551.1 serine--tRNA ligase, putative [Plasmodium knowlesi strain H]SBO24181.1 serine--tRNA ligase, putative [Plasmodium knowlesi strain H]SBO29797.1 serine--tRNA ligase, putative [Plasmodium knowlesi strain H]VVS76025.1 serine--tRNA ligase, putative [Plasmodium knowlesi strain H]|eukprot:XP_002261100.1 seryl-trna synthetase, putative [Plasmodium knowlesi strain H]
MHRCTCRGVALARRSVKEGIPQVSFPRVRSGPLSINPLRGTPEKLSLRPKMVLDINLFRKEKGGNPDKIKESERKRFHDETNVDKVIEYDEKWRKCIFKLEELKKNINLVNKEIGNKKKEDKNANVEDLKKKSLTMKEEIPQLQNLERDLLKQRNKYLSKVGNLLNKDVVISNDEDNNKVVTTWGVCKRLEVITDESSEENKSGKGGSKDGGSNKREVPSSSSISGGVVHPNSSIEGKKYYYHFDLLRKIGGANFKKGIQVAGHRGYYLTGAGFLLHNAILQYAINFLVSKNYTPVYPPFFMKKNIMEECAELDDFEETLYKIASSGGNSTATTGTASGAPVSKNLNQNDELSRDDLFLIATSEQPLCALHKDETIESKYLPLKYAGVSSCFRKEAGAHGKDIRGILRVHQFDKIEQFCLSLPQTSSKVHKQMMKTCEEFYQSLNIPYRIVSIVSGALNNAAAIKYDLEGYFPSSNQYRELVSCSNCTDYQSNNLNVKYVDSSVRITDVKEDRKKKENTGDHQDDDDDDEIGSDHEEFLKNFHTESRNNVHLLNGTMVAAQRFLCCLLENYQNGEGIVVPEKLRPYMNNVDFIPFIE